MNTYKYVGDLRLLNVVCLIMFKKESKVKRKMMETKQDSGYGEVSVSHFLDKYWYMVNGHSYIFSTLKFGKVLFMEDKIYLEQYTVMQGDEA